MKGKQLIALLVLAAVIGVAALIVYKHNSSSWQPAPASGRILGDFALNDVARIVIQSGTGTLTLAKKNDKWVVPDRNDYPADFARIGDFIQALWQLKPTEEVQAGPSQLGRLELLPPAKGDGTGTLVDLQDKNSKRIAALLVGKRFLKKSPEVPDQEGYPAGRYVMPADASPPKVSLVSDPLSQVDPSPAAWLDKSFLQINRIQSVSLVSGTNQWTLSRDSDSGNEWKLAGAKPGQKIDSANVPPFVSVLASPSFTDVLPAGAMPAGVDTTVTITTFDQFTYTLKFGKPEGDNLTMAVAVTANPLGQRTPGKNETPEQKKQLDDEFAAHAKALADVLDKDKAYESRIYLVSKTMFDPLFVSRANILAPPAPAQPSPMSMPPGLQMQGPGPASGAPSSNDAPKDHE